MYYSISYKVIYKIWRKLGIVEDRLIDFRTFLLARLKNSMIRMSIGATSKVSCLMLSRCDMGE